MLPKKNKTYPKAEDMLRKRIAERFPVPNYVIQSVTPDGIDLSKASMERAASVLGVTRGSLENLLKASGCQINSTLRIDIRYMYAIQNEDNLDAANPYEVALAQYRLNLLRKGRKPSPKLTPCIQSAYITNIFREPHCHILQVANRETAGHILRHMLVNEIRRFNAQKIADPFVFEEIVALPVSGSKEEEAVENMIIPGVRLRVDLSELPENSNHEDCLKEVLEAAERARPGKCDHLVYSDALIYTDEILEAEVPGPFSKMLYRRWKEDPDIRAWFSAERIGWPKPMGHYHQKVEDKAKKLFPVAEFLERRETEALITLFGDASTFFDEFGQWVKPEDPHGAIPKRYDVNRKVWREWCARTEEPIWRGEQWIKPIRPAEAIAMFGYQAGFFRRSDRPELYAINTKNTWIPKGPALRRLYQRLHSVGLSVSTGTLIVCGRPMTPEELFCGIAKGVLSQIPPEVAALRQARAAHKH